jgi:hypothetical protein
MKETELNRELAEDEIEELKGEISELLNYY